MYTNSRKYVSIPIQTQKYMDMTNTHKHMGSQYMMISYINLHSHLFSSNPLNITTPPYSSHLIITPYTSTPNTIRPKQH